jgi:hypothetical protein
MFSREGLKVTRETMEVGNGMAVGASRPPLCTRVELRPRSSTFLLSASKVVVF